MAEPHIPHLNVHDTQWEPLVEYGGRQSVLYRSADRRRIAGTFQESGTHRMEMPFDEFVYVIAGSVKISVEGGNSFVAGPGDAFYVRQGMTVTWEMSDDFHDVTVLMSDRPIDQ
jgi:uncharacterized cupin superfamily protein